MTKREQLMSAVTLFLQALDAAQFAPSERDRMIAGVRIFLRAQETAGLIGPATAEDARETLKFSADTKAKTK